MLKRADPPFINQEQRGPRAKMPSAYDRRGWEGSNQEEWDSQERKGKESKALQEGVRISSKLRKSSSF